MKTRHYRFLSWLMGLGCLLLATACSEDVVNENELPPLPEGTGRIRVTICAPESAGGNTPSTRAVNAVPWEDPDHDWETIQTFRILICTASATETGKYNVVQVISGTGDDLTEQTHTESTSEEPADLEGSSTNDNPNSMSSTHKSKTCYSQPLEAGTYYIFAVANFTNTEYTSKFAEGKTINPDSLVQYPNGYSELPTAENYFGNTRDIPMTGKLTTAANSNTMKEVVVTNGAETNAGTISVWRVMGKMQFYFTNESNTAVKIQGVEVYPLNRASSITSGIYLFSKDNLESINNLLSATEEGEHVTLPSRRDVGKFIFQPESALELAAKNNGDTDEGSFFFYVNETDATFTTTNNQLSLRFKVQRQKPGTDGTSENDWYAQEIRYGVTTNYEDGDGKPKGFNVIRRNDWIHIPITLTDWQFRMEPLAFVPIAGYPAVTAKSDGLEAHFSTGGRIILQPFVKKYSDGSWRDFSDPEITYWDENEVLVSDTPDIVASWNKSISWKNDDGDTQSGTGKIISTPFTYDQNSNCFIGELNKAMIGHEYKTTINVKVKLGTYEYTFTFNIILD